jgi:hypothetical protein
MDDVIENYLIPKVPECVTIYVTPDTFTRSAKAFSKNLPISEISRAKLPAFNGKLCAS